MLKFKQFVSESVSDVILEGGNVFAGRTSSIKKDHIEPTLDRYFAELSVLFPKKKAIFNLSHFHPLGSVGKKPVSGDIDLGVDSTTIVDATFSDKSISDWGIDPKAVKADFDKLAKRAKTSTPEQLMMKAFLMNLAMHINVRAPNLHTDEKKITPGNMFGLFPQYDTQGHQLPTGVQIDWMVGNLDWLRFSYYSAAYPSHTNVKGLHRTQLLLSTFQQAGYSFNHVSGVKDKETGEVVATRPDQALDILSKKFKVKFTHDTVEDYFKLHELIKKLPKHDYDGIIDTYFKILDSTRADIPNDMQGEWKKRQARLGLTGKFLPPESELLK